MTRRDKVALLTFEGMTDAEAEPASSVVAGKVWGFDTVSKEYEIPPFLVTELCSVHRGQHHRETCPHLFPAAEAEDFCL